MHSSREQHEDGPSQELVADVFSRQCASRELFEAVTGKWPSLVLLALGEGSHRFGELRRKVDGVSEKMLSQALRTLEDDGLIVRHDHHTLPPRVDYSLTPLGESVAEHLKSLADLLQDTVNRKAKAGA